MKTRCLIYFCLVLTAMNTTGCRKKTPPDQKQSITQPGVAQKPATEQIQPEEIEYFALFMEGKKIGYAIQERAVESSQVTTTVSLQITLSRTGIPVSVQTKSVSFETTDGKPVGFELEQTLGLIATKTTATIDEQGKLIVNTGQEPIESQWPNGAIMNEGMRLLLIKHGLKEGTSYTAKIFEPSTMQAIDVQIEVGSKQNVDLLGRIVALTEVVSTANLPQLGSITSTEYYDDDLRLQKSIMPIMGMTIEQVACTKEFALGEIDVLEVVEKMFLASPQPLKNVNSAQSISYQLNRTDETAEFIIPSNDNQKVQKLSDGNVIITVEPVVASAGIDFPYKGNDAAILEAIEPTRFLQSNDEQIVKLAQKAIGKTKDAAEAAKKIEAFVAGYINNTSLSVGYASASEVAQSKQGDCTEFAVLTAALCRALGIPAQVVAGIAYVDDFAGMRGFGGHAWTQVYIGGKWIGLDAAFKGTGRGGYDAGHIALAVGNGEPGDFLNLITTLGRFKIEKVTVNK